MLESSQLLLRQAFCCTESISMKNVHFCLHYEALNPLENNLLLFVCNSDGRPFSAAYGSYLNVALKGEKQSARNVATLAFSLPELVKEVARL